ncbi:hypothetical protein EST38_g438 [Candolleomyces aberdarensis]|uniref:Type 2A phosphatase activator TIP41 n=1 Tax=Candolleomyces aberdarensis TaxID=2316362 RepID=A0A4Q2DXG9_9AGAR|nr:hypothetical protein EST38_g438 [Candolleomyces aberdarensis]
MAQSQVPIPEHKLLESPNSRTIEIFDWSITASTNPISNASECDSLQATLGFPLPEMTFGNNLLTLEHKSSSWKYSFTTEGALKAVKNGELGPGDGGVKTVPTKPYDWTYTTTYPGGLEPSDSEKPSGEEKPVESKWIAADPEDPSQAIPMAELTRPDPILFYAEIPLFEDELHDNGSSALLVRIRVMPGCLFILARFTLRVDNVLFRQFDTRIYHSFSSSPPLIVRETSGWEAPYDRVKRLLPMRDDLTPLTDPSFITKALTEMPPRLSQGEGGKTGWRALGTRREITKLAS